MVETQPPLPVCCEIVNTVKDCFNFLLFTLQSFPDLIFLEEECVLAYLPFCIYLVKSGLPVSSVCVWVQDKGVIVTWSTLTHLSLSSCLFLPLSRSRPHAFCLSSRDKRHCVHPNSISCHTIFLFLTHSLPSHLSPPQPLTPHESAGGKCGWLSLHLLHPCHPRSTFFPSLHLHPFCPPSPPPFILTLCPPPTSFLSPLLCLLLSPSPFPFSPPPSVSLMLY